MAERKITPKQNRFCQEYIVDLNGTQAAIRAGYSKKTAQEQSARLLSNVMVSARIQELMRDREERIERSADEVVKRLWEVADLKVVGDAGILKNGIFTLTDGSEWSDATKRTVRTIKSTTKITRTKEGEFETIESFIKVPEPVPALIELMKHYGLGTNVEELPPLLTIKLTGDIKLDEPPVD